MGSTRWREWLMAPLRWLMERILESGTYKTSETPVHGKVIDVTTDTSDTWVISGAIWEDIAPRFGFDFCGKMHMNSRLPYYAFLCDTEPCLWPNYKPRCMKSRFKVKVIQRSIRGTAEAQDDSLCARHRHMRYGPPAIAPGKREMCFVFTERSQRISTQIPIPLKPCEHFQMDRLLVVGYSRSVAVVLQTTHLGLFESQTLHFVDIPAKLYLGYCRTDSFVNCYISPDESLLIICHMLHLNPHRGTTRFLFLRRVDDRLVTVHHLAQADWRIYCHLSFRPDFTNHRFVIGGSVHSGQRLCSMLISYEVPENAENVVVTASTMVHYHVAQVNHSPDGLLLLVADDRNRGIYIYNSDMLTVLRIFDEKYFAEHLGKGEVLFTPRVHYTRISSINCKLWKGISGCNVCPFSRGSALIAISIRSQNESKASKVIVTRVPMLEVKLKQLCKRQILQTFKFEEIPDLPLPNDMKSYIMSS